MRDTWPDPDHPADLPNPPWRVIGLAICEALNIDVDNVTGFTLTIQVGHAPLLEVRRRVVNADAGRLADAVGTSLVVNKYKIAAPDDPS